MKMNIRTKDTVLTATLLGSKAARDFASLLPLKLTMQDLFRREKYAQLPRRISEEGKRKHAFEVGEIAYWPPGPDVAVFYRDDGQTIPSPGIVVLGKLDGGVEILNHPGSTLVTFELAADSEGRR